MTFSKAARQRTIRGVEQALVEVGPPWRRFGLALFGAFTHETAMGSETLVLSWDKLLEHLDAHAEEHPADAAMVRDIERHIKFHRDEIPHVIMHDSGTELCFITPPDGADA